MLASSKWQGNAEVATIVHNGKTFTNLGAVITPDNMTGYVKRHDATGRYYLTTWDGSFMFVELLPGKRWKRWHYHGYTTFQEWRAIINGFWWTGRQGDFDLLRLRRTKREA